MILQQAPSGGLQPCLEDADVVLYGINTAVGEVEQELLARWIPLDGRVRVGLRSVVEVRGRGGDADRLAGEAFLGQAVDGRVLGRGDCRRRVVIFLGEVDLLGAFRRDRHRCDDRVELAGLQRRDDAVPILRDELAGHLHLRAERIGDVDVEAFELAVGGQVVERRIGAFGADLQRCLRGAWSCRRGALDLRVLPEQARFCRRRRGFGWSRCWFSRCRGCFGGCCAGAAAGSAAFSCEQATSISASDAAEAASVKRFIVSIQIPSIFPSSPAKRRPRRRRPCRASGR